MIHSTCGLRRISGLAALAAPPKRPRWRFLGDGLQLRPRSLPNVPRLWPARLRSYSRTAPRWNTNGTVRITYIEADGTEKPVDAEIGKNLLDVAHDNNVELEGACGGELACSTCHLIFEPAIYDTLPAKEDDEDDMLDMAFEVTETSRLGCQILVRKDFVGMKVRIPDDGF